MVSEVRMAMKDGELGIWDSVHPCYTVFHEQTETFSSLWSEYHDDFRQFLHIYSQDVACYGENLAYFPKGFIENMFFVSANPWVSFTSFDLNVANMDNFFAPVFTMGKYYTQGDKVLMPLAIQVHHAVCDGFHVGRMLNELQQSVTVPLHISLSLLQLSPFSPEVLLFGVFMFHEFSFGRARRRLSKASLSGLPSMWSI